MLARPPLRRRWPLVAAAAVVPLLLLAAAPGTEPGLTYEFRSVATQGEGDAGRTIASVTGRAQVVGGQARIDLTDATGPNPFTRKGTYVVVGADGRMLMVSPEEKQYYAFNMEQMLAGLGSAMNAMGGLMKMTMTDVKVDVQDLGAGGKMHGYDTRHLRMTQSYTMTISIMGRKQVTSASDTMETWVAPALKDVVNPFLRMGNAAGALDFGNPDYRRQMQAANAKLAVGLPLKSVTRSVAKDEKGKEQRTSVTVEVTTLARGDVAAAAFAVPAGYQEVQMPMAEFAALGDSLNAAKARNAAAGADTAAKPDGPDAASVKDAAKNAAEKTGKAAAAEEAKKRLRGIFKRPPSLR
jgi:hypothetical protein